MASDNENTVRFGLATDSHYAQRPNTEKRYYKDSLSKMNVFAEHMNKAQVDFVIHLGDFKDQDAVPVQNNTLKYLRQLELSYQQFDGDTYHVIGNHDVDSITKTQFLENIANTGIDSSRSYYSYDQSGYHFVVLDGCFNENGESYAPGNFQWDRSYIPQQQLKWLRKDLEKNTLPTVVFCHQMLFGEGKHAVINASEVREVLEESGDVIASFHGHVHKELHEEINGIQYFSFNGMVDLPGLNGNCYHVLTISPSKGITIEGYYNATNRTFDL